jgi:hypothetical protein
VTTPAGRSRLESIPGVGPSIARDLQRLGVRRVDDLRGRDPARLYDELESVSGAHVDRCVLYVFRCAVHYAGEPEPDGELTKWWNWKDGGLAQERGLI